jgi:hypothetical protein
LDPHDSLHRSHSWIQESVPDCKCIW